MFPSYVPSPHIFDIILLGPYFNDHLINGKKEGKSVFNINAIMFLRK